jgi:hypothetical protein
VIWRGWIRFIIEWGWTSLKSIYYKNKYILIWIPNCGPFKVGVKNFVTEIIVENVNSLDKKAVV